jgi:hypothetical protein
MRLAQDVIDAEFAAQEAANLHKLMAKRNGMLPPDRRDAAVELAALIPPPGGWISPAVDVNRTPLPPVGSSPMAPQKPVAYCKYCGKLFQCKTLVAAKMTKGRHEKKAHAGESATAA